jgi:hypothetical protein
MTKRYEIETSYNEANESRIDLVYFLPTADMVNEIAETQRCRERNPPPQQESIDEFCIHFVPIHKPSSSAFRSATAIVADIPIQSSEAKTTFFGVSWVAIPVS